MFNLNKLLTTVGYTVTKITSNNLFPENGLTKILGGYVQTRDIGKTTRKRRTTHAPRWCVPRRRKFAHELLTSDNKQFLREVISESYTDPGISPLKEPLFKRGEWSPESVRTGVIARKIGIYPMWDKNGKRFATTLLQVLDNQVINYVPPEQVKTSYLGFRYNGLAFLVVGAENGDPQKFTAAYNGLFTKAGVMPKKKLTRFVITPDAALPPGTPLNISHFRPGEYVDIYGKTVGHGFQGVVKRWGFKGGPATHGNTKNHRRTGNIGAGSGRSGNVWKGKKMPGHMGQERRIHAGVQIYRINYEYNVMWVKGGSVPGSTHAYVYIMDSRCHKKKHTEENPPPFPTSYPDEIEKFPREVYAENIHQFSEPTVVYSEVVMAAGKKKK